MKATLIRSEKYSIDELADCFIGWWSPGQGLQESIDSYRWAEYFDGNDRYAGPDYSGIEPVFDLAAIPS